jgi:hypothetical protein
LERKDCESLKEAALMKSRIFAFLILLSPYILPGHLAARGLSSRPGARNQSGRLATPAGPITQLTLNSQPGMFGASVNSTYTTADGAFSGDVQGVNGEGSVSVVAISFIGTDGVEWAILFGTTSAMAVGIYNQAEGPLFNALAAGYPGIELDGTNPGTTSRQTGLTGAGHSGPRGDATIDGSASGRFAVLDASFDYSSTTPRVVSFAALFELHGNGYTAGMTGSVYFNSTPTQTLALSNTSVEPGGQTQGTVTLPAPAPAGGALISLLSVDPTSVTVPASLSVAPQQTTATFAVVETGALGPRSVPVLAVYNGVASYAILQVASSVPPVTMLQMKTKPGDSFGNGKKFLYTPDDGLFRVQSSSNVPSITSLNLGITFSGNDPGVLWTVEFSTERLGIPIARGTYQHAQRADFEKAGHPGLDVSGISGCNKLTGSFTVIDATFDETFYPAVALSFAVKFNEQCVGFNAGLTGQIYYNYSPPASSR